MSGVYRQVLDATERPAWATGAMESTGSFRIEPGTDREPLWDEAGQIADYGRFDPHHHPAHEFWFISKGRGVIRIADSDHDFGPGDIICIEGGSLHDVTGAYETVEGFWFQSAWPADVPFPDSGLPSHVHPTPEDAHGHVVALLT
jgi:mannose-6-phosphate isomerase-like protein (cupin superfamily)